MLALIAKITAFPVLALLFRVRTHGYRPALKGPAIIVYNHISRVDAIIISHVFSHKKIRFMAKKEIFRRPINAFLSRLIGMYPADGTESSVKLLSAGKTIAITPEGTRSADSTKPFHTGAVLISMRSGVPIYPVRIRQPFSFFSRTEISFGNPVFFETPKDQSLSHELLSDCSEKLRQYMLTL